ncbi:YraN family protein [Marinicrinis lubricantis]|uniref:UPF0102 protein ACFPXP_07470 n=1 Tax=Marinicrinis lubricantis TaxID=2086470 RepID=A0ABW1IMG9_9BACL
MNRKQKGQLAEEAACRFLLLNGVYVIDRNWRCRSGEIDIVAEDGEELVFVEVRSKQESSPYGTALDAVDARKQLQVRRTAEVYLHQQQRFDAKIRFDVIGVEFKVDGKWQITHVPYAF